MTASRARRGGFNDADLRYASRTLLALREARDRSDEAAAWASDPRLRAIALRTRATQEGDIRALTTLLKGWGRGGDTDQVDSWSFRRRPGDGTSDFRVLDGRELDRHIVVTLTSRAEAAIVSARAEMVDGFEGASRRIAEGVIRASLRDLSALGRLAPADARSLEPGRHARTRRAGSTAS